MGNVQGGLTVAVENRPGGSLPKEFSLAQNYPNPFNGVTNFELRIVGFGLISLKVFDLLGREVATLVNNMMQAGTFGIAWDAGSMPSGVYFARLQAGTFVQTRKLLLLK